MIPLTEIFCLIDDFCKLFEQKQNRVELGIADPTLSHHRTSDVAYGGFAVMFTKSY